MSMYKLINFGGGFESHLLHSFSVLISRLLSSTPRFWGFINLTLLRISFDLDIFALEVHVPRFSPNGGVVV